MPNVSWNEIHPTVFERAFKMALLNWLGTPYLLGGQDENGIDCSGVIVEAFADIGLDITDRSSDDFVQGVDPSALFTLRSMPARGPIICGICGYTTGTAQYGHIAIEFNERFVIHSTEMATCVAANGASGVMISKRQNLYIDLAANFDEIHLRWLNFGLFLSAHNSEGA
jgi:hypothetical protein